MQELNEKYVGKHIGPNEISGVEVTELATPSGGMVFQVTYTTGKSELFPEKGFVAVVSDEAKDFNHLRDVRVALLVPEILNVIKEYDIPFDQFTYLMTQVASQLQNHFNRANAILWHGNADSYVPGVDTIDMLTLTMADRVNARVSNKENEG